MATTDGNTNNVLYWHNDMKSEAFDVLYVAGISWLKGNAECLPVSDNTYDAYTIAFGIRNTTHIDKVIIV